MERLEYIFSHYMLFIVSLLLMLYLGLNKGQKNTADIQARFPMEEWENDLSCVAFKEGKVGR